MKKIFRRRAALLLALILCAMQFFSFAASAGETADETQTQEETASAAGDAEEDAETEDAGAKDAGAKDAGSAGLQGDTESARDTGQTGETQAQQVQKSAAEENADEAEVPVHFASSGGGYNPHHGVGEVHEITDFVLNSMTASDGVKISDFSMTIDGQYRGYCAEFDLDTGPQHVSMPTVHAYTAEDTSEKSVLLRKVMYYGAAGPGAILEDNAEGRIRTALAVSYVCTGLDIRRGFGRDFVSRVSSMPDAPDGFSVYVLANGSEQDTAYAVYSPKLTLSLRKQSAQTECTEQNSCYSLEGALYKVYTDADLTQEAGQLTVGADGTSNSLKLSPGIYYVREEKAPAGYKMDDQVYTVKLEKEDVQLTVKDVPLVYDGLLRIAKTDAQTGAGPADDTFSLAGAQFSVTFYAGRGDGYQDAPSRSWIIETAEKDDGSFTAALDKEHLVSGDAFFMQDGKVCLPEGTLVIEEVKAPAGYTLDKAVLTAEKTGESGQRIVTEISEENGSCVIAAGNAYTASDAPVSISTTAHAKNSDLHEIARQDVMTVVDTVKYSGLTAGDTYTLRAQLVGADGQEAASGEKTFTPEEADGSVDVELTVPNGDFDRLVVFERLYDENNELVARHTDQDDEEQTVYFPKIGTAASCGSGKEKSAEVSDHFMVRDEVSYEGLIKGKTYRLEGRLMDVETGKAVEVNGKAVTAQTQFRAEQSSGKVQVEFTFDAAAYAGRKLVVFEKLYTGETEIAAHEDISSEEQAFSIVPGTPQESTGQQVKTGDHAHIGLYVLLCAAGGVAAAVIVIRKKMNRNRTDS